MGFDGKLKFDTGIDLSGFQNGISNLGGLAQKGLSDVSGLAQKGLSGISGLASKGLDVIKSSVTSTVDIMGQLGGKLADLTSQSVDLGSQFEYGMAKVSTMSSDTAGVDALGDSIIALSNSTGIASSTFTEAGYSALSASVPLKDVASTLDTSAKLSVAGFTSVDTAVDGLTSVINAYGSDVMDADKAGKIFMQTQNLGKTTVDELASSLSNVTPTASAMGVTFEQVGASLATITAKGTPTAQATTQLNNVIAELGKSGAIANKNLMSAAEGTQYAGMSFQQMMDSGATLDEILLMMSSDAEVNGKSLIDMFGSIDAGKGALSLVSDGGEMFQKSLEGMSTQADVVGEAYEKMSDTFENKTNILKTNAQNLGVKVYQGISNPLKQLAEKGTEYLTQLSDAFDSGGLEGIASAIGGVASDIVTQITSYLPNIIDMGLNIVNSLIAGIQQNSSTIGKNGATVITSLIKGFTGAFGKIYGVGLEILSQLLDGLLSNSGEIIDIAKNTIVSFVRSLITYLPKILETGGQLLNSLINGLITMLPALILQAKLLVSLLLSTISANLPMLLDSGIKILLAIIGGIIEMLPTLIPAVIQIIECIGQAVIDNLPLILQAGIDLLFGLIDGLLQDDNLSKIIDATMQIIAMICDQLLTTDNLDKLFNAAFQILDGLIKGVGDNLPKLIDCATKIITNLIDYLLDEDNQQDLIDGAGKIMESLGKGLRDALGSLKDFVVQLFEKLKQLITDTDWASLGKSILDGLFSGLLDVDFDTKDFCDNFVEEWRLGLGIHSPSKVFQDEIGRYIPQGISVGIKAEMPNTLNGLQTDVNTLANGIDTSSVYSQFAGKSNSQGCVPAYSNVYSPIVAANRQLEQNTVPVQQNSTDNSNWTMPIYMFPNDQALGTAMVSAIDRANVMSGGYTV